MPVDPPAVILGGEANAISVARSLGRAGIAVYAVGSGSEPVRFSRFCTVFVKLGGPDIQFAWLNWLRSSGPRGAVLLPCTDDGLELIARHRSELVELGYRPIEANDEVLLTLLDKERTYTLARTLGVPAPRTVTVRSGVDLGLAKNELTYPCALKPLHSHLFARHFPTTKAFVVGDPAELDAVFGRLNGLGLEMLVTEIVSGTDGRYVSYYTYLDQDGQSLLSFTKHKIRQFPTGFGLASFQVSKWDPQVAELGLRFCQGVGLRGLAAVEFKYDSNGCPTLIECNHRFTAANELVRLAGIDLGLFTFSRLAGRPCPPVGSFKDGVYMWNPIQDVRALRSYRRAGELSFLSWARSLVRPVHFPVARWYDPLPTAGYHWRWLIRGIRRWHLRARFGDHRLGMTSAATAPSESPTSIPWH